MSERKKGEDDEVLDLLDKIDKKPNVQTIINKLTDENKVLTKKLEDITKKYEYVQQKNIELLTVDNRRLKENKKVEATINSLLQDKENLRKRIREIENEKHALIERIKELETGKVKEKKALKIVSADLEPMSKRPADFKMKLVMLGDFAVGKTSFIKNFAKKKFGGDYKPTIGAEITKLSLEYEKKLFGLIMWDLAGQVAFKQLAHKYIEGSDLAVMIFDVTRPMTFESVKGWFQAMMASLNEKIPCVLVGNKVDLVDERKVSYDDALQLSQELGLNYIEISVKENQNVQDAMISLIENYLGTVS